MKKLSTSDVFANAGNTSNLKNHQRMLRLILLLKLPNLVLDLLVGHIITKVIKWTKVLNLAAVPAFTCTLKIGQSVIKLFKRSRNAHCLMTQHFSSIKRKKLCRLLGTLHSN